MLLEASSHGLKMHRMGGVEVAVAGFTNLSRDHMDFHGNMEDYKSTKARLFEEVAAAAAFNIDDAVGAELAEGFLGERLTVSTSSSGADLWLESLVCDLAGCRATLHHGGGSAEFVLPLIGRHNAENALVALAMWTLAGLPLEDGLKGLATAPAAPGRLELVEGHVPVLVDYAHSPDALENVLRSLRPLVSGRILCVFGAGGDRDPGKRPLMGAVVSAWADVAIVTSDNPRTEDPQGIVDAIVGGLQETQERWVVLDRREAIERAISMAGADDLVLIAGKGHEASQETAGHRRPFDDRLEAARALKAAQGRPEEGEK